MEQRARLAARLGSLGELRDLIRAMRAMAAARVQEAQSALPGIRRYAAVIEDGIQKAAALAARNGAARPELSARRADRLLVAACSEHGFAGAFNERLLDKAAARAAGRTLAVIGRRGAARAAERGMACAWILSAATHVGGVLGVARDAARRLAGAAEVIVIFGRYGKGGHVEAEARCIYPLPPDLLVRAAQGEPPIHQLPAAVLLERLAAEYVLAEMAQALTESLASENGARLMLMDSADRNIGSKLEGLRRLERRARQEAVTEELIDVATGAEAVLARGR